MPVVTIKLIPGVNVERTPVLNEAGVSASNLIRFRDGLVEKLGGWQKFYNFTIGGIVRCLHAWQALNNDDFLASGSTTNLSVIQDGALTNITPQKKTTNFNPDFATIVSTPTVTIVDPNVTNVTTYDSVYFNTPVAVGGLILSGLYPIDSVAAAHTYRIIAQANATLTRENLGISNITQANPGAVTYTGNDDIANGDLVYLYGVGGMTQVNGNLYTVAGLSTGGAGGSFQLSGINTTGFSAYTSGGTVSPAAVAKFTTTSGDPSVSVTLQAHGLSNGDKINLPIATTVGGITISGSYPVTSVTSANVFVITASSAATSGATALMNSGSAQILYYITLGPAASGSGYSIGGYGLGGYSTGSTLTVQTGTPITATDWSLDNWGQILLANPAGGAIYYWEPNSGFLNAQLVSTGPIFNASVFVSQQSQILVALGSTTNVDIGVTSNPLEVKWSDQLDFLAWTPTDTNQAGSYVLPTGSKIIGGLAAPHQDLVWTDLDLWSMNYLGFPLVFGFDKIGSNCGLVARGAAVRQGANVYWMGGSNFFSLGSGGAQPIACTVWDKVFQNLNTDFSNNIRAWSNTPFNEIWWFYPSSASVNGENDSYVKLNTLYGLWDYGPMARSAAIDQSVLGMPIAADPTTGYIYQHERGYDADGAPINAFFESGWSVLAEGEILAFADWMLPDMIWQTADASTPSANVQITLYFTDYPGQTPRTVGPFTVMQATRFVNLRGRGRYYKYRLSSGDLGSFWRNGGTKLRVAQDGRR